MLSNLPLQTVPYVAAGLVLLGVGCGSTTPGVPQTHSAGGVARAEAIPTPVEELFSAVKDSLDYGHIDGDALARPRAALSDYARVTDALLAKIATAWQIVSYSATDDEYEIIVESKDQTPVRYRATRMERYIWRNGRWVSVGGYTYL
jgi:hypothetical protein